MGKRKDRHQKSKSIKKKDLQSRIRDFFTERPGVSADYRAIASYIGVRDSYTARQIGAALSDMCERGMLLEKGHGRYAQVADNDTTEGQIRLQKGGSGLLLLENGTEVYIPARQTRHALNEDTVRVRYYYSQRYKKVEGEVLEVIERARDTFVGVLEVDERVAFLLPENRNMPYDIFVPLDQLKGGKHGQKAIVQITSWPAHERNPVGEVVEVLGTPGQHEVEMHAILAAFGLPYRYPQEVEQFAQGLDDGITPEEIAKRRDFRSVPTLTIDPKTAKDFDDAISYRELDDGALEVGVHIADVSFYVRPGSILDDEAYARATSVYLVDRTIPMLPERLSNGICSLRPQEDKLSYSVVFRMNAKGVVLDSWIGRTVINSDARLTYEEAQTIIQGGEHEFAHQIRMLNAISQQLRERRFADGAIDFVSGEVAFRLDQEGKPLEVIPQVYDESHQLIEELMLLANRTVAEYVGRPEKGKTPAPFVYRVHDKPKPEKLDSLFGVIAKFGKPFQGDTTRVNGRDITQMMRSMRGRPEQHFIDMLAIRSMAKAIYSTKNIGHYGLAFPFYTHFTSPIRRYPDLMVHRILTDLLAGRKSSGERELSEWCEHASAREKLATDAERASIKYKQVEYMGAHLGEEFDGVISGVTDFGFFVELTDSKCDGLVAMRDMQDDYYYFDQEAFSIIGERTRKAFRLGDPVRVKVSRTDLLLKQLDFELVGHQNEPMDLSQPGKPRRAEAKQAGGKKGKRKKGAKKPISRSGKKRR